MKFKSSKITYIYIFLSILFQSLSVILGKFASLYIKEFNIMNIILNPFYILSIVCLGFQAIFWQLTLKNFSLSFSYMFNSMVYIVILVASHFFFNENISIFNIIGSLLIILGLIVMTANFKRCKNK